MGCVTFLAMRGAAGMGNAKMRIPALATAALTLVAAALTATVSAASAAPAPAGRAAANATAWKIQPTPNPKIPQGRLNAVSCSSPRACTAVGVFDNVPGRGTLAERWDGASWSIQASANPAGALTAVLFGVSCPAATFCVAVGNYQNRTGRHAILAEAWNGSSWSVLPAPPPAGARRSFLNGVSCTSATACTAVGSYQARSGKHVTLAERWDGTTWSIQPTPNPATPPRSALAAVSCTSASACTAVGSSAVDNFGSSSVTLAERWDGTTWSIQPTPNNPHGNFLTGVSCPSPAACIAVGGNNGLPLVEAWNGTSWSIPPTPATGGAQLNSVSCALPSACTAVGSGAFAERWNGTAWSIQPIPGIHDNAALTSVSCTTTSTCTAAGFDLEATLGEAWDGTSWSVEPTPSPASLLGTHRLTAVSCTSPSACMAVGLTPEGLSSVTLAERWDGIRWTIVPTPSRGESELSGVSCTSPSACIAVGRSFPEGVLSERWDGTRWSLLKTPNPVHLGDLFSVSCTSASACVAVGGANNDRLTLAEVWNGTSWKIQPTPSTAHADVDVLSGVSCTSPSACTAVGEVARFGGRPMSLAERWDGTSWSIQPTANPPGSGNMVFLNSVSCTSGSACTAVGSFINSSGQGATLAEAWDGTTWSIQPTPALPPQDLPNFGGVSCTSGSACIAVGAAADTLAEVWNGTAWSIDPTPPSPPSLETIGGRLDGVWCTSAASCTAVGSYFNSGGNELTLAEARS